MELPEFMAARAKFFAGKRELVKLAGKDLEVLSLITKCEEIIEALTKMSERAGEKIVIGE